MPSAVSVSDTRRWKTNHYISVVYSKLLHQLPSVGVDTGRRIRSDMIKAL